MVSVWKRKPEPGGERFTLIERSAHTFQAYLQGPLGDIFYDRHYRDELARRFAELNARLNRAMRLCVVLLALILFSDALGEINIAAGLVQIPSLGPFKDALVFLLAAASLALSLAILDHVLLERYLHQIYFSAGLFQPRFFYMHIFPLGLWNDVVQRRLWGPASLVGHNTFRILLLVLFTIPVMALVLAGPTIAFLYSIPLVLGSDQAILARALGALSILLSLGSVIALIGGWAVPFRFGAADREEATGNPTAEFQARMKAEVTAANELQETRDGIT